MQRLEHGISNYKRVPSAEIDALVPKMMEMRKQGMSYNEIGEKLGVDKTTVHKRLSRGTKKLNDLENVQNLRSMIEVVTIGKIPDKLMHDLLPKLEETFSPLIHGCLQGASLGMPPAARNTSRKQYDADIILERTLHRITGENKVLALTSYDLYTSSRNLNFIFGQAQCPGRVALVSLHRLDPAFYGQPPNYELFLERSTKEAVHELGHTFRLGHCLNPKCVMSFSNSILDVDNKGSAFCKTCRRKLHRQSTFLIHVWR